MSLAASVIGSASFSPVTTDWPAATGCARGLKRGRGLGGYRRRLRVAFRVGGHAKKAVRVAIGPIHGRRRRRGVGQERGERALVLGFVDAVEDDPSSSGRIRPGPGEGEARAVDDGRRGGDLNSWAGPTTVMLTVATLLTTDLSCTSNVKLSAPL